MMAQSRPTPRLAHGAVWLAMALTIAALVGHAIPARAGAPAQVLYGADGAGGNPATNLYTLDPATGGILTTVGPIGFAVTGLAFHPTTGILYGTTGNNPSAPSPGFLIAIDTATGAGIPIGDLVPGAGGTAADITFGADGTLYGWLEPSADDLVTIDLLTGLATVVGSAGLSTAGGGLAGSGNPVILAGEGGGGCVSLIDTGTGAVTDPCVVTLDSTPGREIAALDFNAGGILYGVNLDDAGGSNPRPADLVTIDTATGATTIVGATVDRLDAIAFGLPIPAPTPVPSLPNAATTQPSGDADRSGLVWAFGLLMLISAAGLAIARSRATVRSR